MHSWNLRVIQYCKARSPHEWLVVFPTRRLFLSDWWDCAGVGGGLQWSWAPSHSVLCRLKSRNFWSVVCAIGNQWITFNTAVTRYLTSVQELPVWLCSDIFGVCSCSFGQTSYEGMVHVWPWGYKWVDYLLAWISVKKGLTLLMFLMWWYVDL